MFRWIGLNEEVATFSVLHPFELVGSTRRGCLDDSQLRLCRWVPAFLRVRSKRAVAGA
jgi:hypothetical protein